MAENGREILEQSKTTVDKETRLRILKDRQNEERQRKLEEIKAQALAAQKFKEQKEAERRKRLEELRLKDEQRRLQVEEKKRAINEAERNRLEFIIKRNQEREQRIEAKKRNERSNAVFAFGSSTPRMLEPSDLTVSFWGSRRATSIQNITSAAQSSLTRRQSERDLDLAGKKRATSATGLERSTDGSEVVIPAGCASGYMGRRRTDLVPTVPTRDSSFSSSRKSLNQSPGRAYSMSRLDQLARPRRPHMPSVTETGQRGSGGNATNPVTRSMSHLAIAAPSAGGGSRLSLSRSVHHLPDAAGPPQRPVRTTRAVQLREQKMLAKTANVASSNCSEASSRPSSSLSQQSTNSVASSVNVRHRISTTPRKPRPVSIAVTGISHDKIDKETKPPLPKMRSIGKTKDRTVPRKPSEDVPKEKVAKEAVGDAKITEERSKIEKSKDEPKTEKSLEEIPEKVIEVQKDVVQIEKTEPVSEPLPQLQIIIEKDTKEMLNKIEEKQEIQLIQPEPPKETEQIKPESQTGLTPVQEVKEKGIEDKDVKEQEVDDKELKEKSNENEKPKLDEQENSLNAENNEMTTSFSKVRISTEEEAKAAIAERRRHMREEAERQAELERQRQEAEAKAELERQQREEEQVRQLIEMQRQAEQERLQEAIREAQKREEEERLRKEEEQRLKLLKEEAERKAKEDAERQKAELQERLRNEEREREARRKRVEAIMLRTRGKNNANLTSQQSTDEKNENKSDENKMNEESKMNGTKIEQQENGTTNNDKQSELVDNIMQEEIIKNANTIESINSINSNSAWRESQQYDSLM